MNCMQEDAKDAFKQLLRDKGISSEATWDQAMRLITNDSRFAACQQLSGCRALHAADIVSCHQRDSSCSAALSA